MKSTATNAKDYLASLPEDRRAALEAVRKVILANLDKDYEECMVWGVLGYVVPYRVWPSGHHTDSSKPLMMCGLSSQKNDMVLYMTNVFGGGRGLGGDKALREWFEQAWAKAGKRLHMAGGSGGAGCCVRFTKLEDIALDVIGDAVRRTPAKAYVQNHLEGLASRGKVPDPKESKGTAKQAVKETVAKKLVKKPAKR